MRSSYLNALGAWLGALEGLAAAAGLRGLSWGGGPGATLLAGAGLAARPAPRTLALTLLPALLLQVGLATLRQRHLDPKRALLPGAHAGYTVARIDVPMAHGPVPALHIVPARGATGAVCVAHGSGCDKTFYAWRLVEDFTARGLAVLLIDLDGHGESPRPQSFPEIIESVAGPARWLGERYARVGLLGMSLGGAVTARAVADGAPCDALALWAVPPRLRMSMAGYRRAQLTEALRLARPQLLHLFRDGSAYHIARAWRTSGIRARIGTWDLFDALDVPGSLGRIAARATRPPLLLIYAGRDGVLPVGAAEEIRAATAGWGEFHLVRGASHVSVAIEMETIRRTGSWFAALLL
ncbi:MAG: alpha/beta fold hydrolase [Chloroflexaceae bacterium]